MVKTVGEVLLSCLKTKGMSQRELAKKSGITEISICRYIKGQRTMSLDTLLKICNALEISPSTFMEMLMYGADVVLTSSIYVDRDTTKVSSNIHFVEPNKISMVHLENISAGVAVNAVKSEVEDMLEKKYELIDISLMSINFVENVKTKTAKVIAEQIESWVRGKKGGTGSTGA